MGNVHHEWAGIGVRGTVILESVVSVLAAAAVICEETASTSSTRTSTSTGTCNASSGRGSTDYDYYYYYY